jgi:hypothetical protein
MTKQFPLIRAFSLMIVGGCSSFQPEPITPSDEMRGPGLFSGPEGVFKIPLFNSSSLCSDKTLETEKKTECCEKEKET